jgi:hypothetical protein
MQAFGGLARVEMFTLDDAIEGESSPGTNAATPAAS